MKTVITIVGPTAGGKTGLAIALAKMMDGEIVSADSRQIYKRLDIGTAKPTPAERRHAVFHLIDFIEPDAEYSCGQFGRDAEHWIKAILEKGRTPIVCGGTGLYIKALFDPLHPLPRSTRETKEKLSTELENRGLEFMYRRLQRADPDWARKIKANDKQRIMRGLEILELTGQTLTSLLDKPRPRARFRARYFGIRWPRSRLYERIDGRFDRMIANGLVDEIRGILKLGYAADRIALRTIGYRELIEYLLGKASLAEAVLQAKKNTRNFAKRQMTWFGKVTGVKWLDGVDDVEKMLSLFLGVLAQDEK
jgi:tRNA dimethylallyltransferase